MDRVTETDRLIISKIDPDDTDRLYQLTGDPRVMQFFPKVLSYNDTRQMLNKIICHYFTHGYCFWKLLQKDNSVFIGITGLLHQDIEGEVETEISYRIVPEYWNLGYATEAALACKQYGQTVLNKKRLISLIRPENKASIRVAQKLGAKRTRKTTFRGLAHDIYVY